MLRCVVVLVLSGGLTLSVAAQPAALPEPPTLPEIPSDLLEEVQRYREMIQRLEHCEVLEAGSFQSFVPHFEAPTPAQRLCEQMNTALHRRNPAVVHAFGLTVVERASRTHSPEIEVRSRFDDREWVERLSRQPYPEAAGYLVHALGRSVRASDLTSLNIPSCTIHRALHEQTRHPGEPIEFANAEGRRDCADRDSAIQAYRGWIEWHTTHHTQGIESWWREADRLANRQLIHATDRAALLWASRHLLTEGPYESYPRVIDALEARTEDPATTRARVLFPNAEFHPFPWYETTTEERELRDRLPEIPPLPSNQWLRFWGLRRWAEGLSCFFFFREGAAPDCDPLTQRLAQGGSLGIRLTAYVHARERLLADRGSILEMPHAEWNEGSEFFLPFLAGSDDWIGVRYLLHAYYWELTLPSSSEAHANLDRLLSELEGQIERIRSNPIHGAEALRQLQAYYQSAREEVDPPNCAAVRTSLRRATGHDIEGNPFDCTINGLRAWLDWYAQHSTRPLLGARRGAAQPHRGALPATRPCDTLRGGHGSGTGRL